MRVNKTETRALKIEHRLLQQDWPRPYTSDEYPSVIQSIQDGDFEIRSRTILSFIPLLGQIVGRYCAKLGTLRYTDELMSSGLEGITYAIERVENGHLNHDNLGGYVVSFIHQYLSTCTERLPLVRVPGGTVRAYKKRKIDIPDRFTRRRLKDVEYENPDHELSDLIDCVCVSNREKTILKMRQEGFTDSEIAEHIGVHRTTVSLTRREIGKRLLRELDS